MINWFKRKRFQTKANLVKVFDNGKFSYYRFAKEQNMSLERMSLVMSLLERLSCGLSGEEMESILEKMESALADGLSKPRNAALVATYINIIRERQDTVIHRDLMLNLAAAFIIRSDEDPMVVNSDIHTQKLNLFEALSKEGAHGFFTSLGIEPLLPLISMSPENFTKLWEHNVQQQRLLIEALNQLDSHRDTGQGKLKKISETTQ